MRQLNDSRSLSRGRKIRPGLSAIARRAEEEGTDESSPALKAFGAGLAFFDTTVPVGTIDFRCRSPKNGPTSYLSIVPTGTVVFFRH